MKKLYTTPAVVAEEALEQTSLGCNATQEYPYRIINNEMSQALGASDGTYARGLDCAIDVGKGSSFSNEEVCAIVVPDPDAIVVLS